MQPSEDFTLLTFWVRMTISSSF